MDTLYNHFDLNSTGFLDDPAEFRLKVKTFVSGEIDFIMTKIKHRIQRASEPIRGMLTHYSDKTDEEKRADNVARAARRAKQYVTHAVRQIQADHMLTLTTRDNITDRDQFMQIFARFIRLVRTKDLINGELRTRQSPRSFPFCAVPELQQRGAYHMHCAVVGFQNIPLLRAAWYVALGGNVDDTESSALGQIDVTSKFKRWGGKTDVWDTSKLVGYLTKYIAKSFEQDDSLGVHRYTKSRGIPPVNIQKQSLIACFSRGKDGVDAMREVIAYAEFLGVQDYFVWGRGLEVFCLKGKLYE